MCALSAPQQKWEWKNETLSLPAPLSWRSAFVHNTSQRLLSLAVLTDTFQDHAGIHRKMLLLFDLLHDLLTAFRLHRLKLSADLTAQIQSCILICRACIAVKCLPLFGMHAFPHNSVIGQLADQPVDGTSSRNGT